LPVARHGERFLVPAIILGEELHGCGLGAESLCLPTAGHLDGLGEWDRRALPFLLAALAAGVELEAPRPVQVDLGPGRRQRLGADETLRRDVSRQNTGQRQETNRNSDELFAHHDAVSLAKCRLFRF
jgi:hypothetical protein